MKGSEAQKQRPYELLWMLRFDEKSISKKTLLSSTRLKLYISWKRAQQNNQVKLKLATDVRHLFLENMTCFRRVQIWFSNYTTHSHSKNWIWDHFPDQIVIGDHYWSDRRSLLGPNFRSWSDLIVDHFFCDLDLKVIGNFRSLFSPP